MRTLMLLLVLTLLGTILPSCEKESYEPLPKVKVEDKSHEITIKYIINSRGSGILTYAGPGGEKHKTDITSWGPYGSYWTHSVVIIQTVETPYTARLYGHYMEGEYKTWMQVGGCVYEMTGNEWPNFEWTYFVNTK